MAKKLKRYESRTAIIESDITTFQILSSMAWISTKLYNTALWNAREQWEKTGKIHPGDEVISCGGTYKGLDTALIVKTCYSHKFFEQFEVREIIAKPMFLVHDDYQYPDKNWKGDLEKYYERLKNERGPGE